MCSQNAGNVISEPTILKIFPGHPLESLSMSPPPQTKPKLYAYGSFSYFLLLYATKLAI